MNKQECLTPDHRIHYKWEYRRFFGKSEVFRLSECTLFRIENQYGHFRLGITLKARGSSVERNRVKRVVREFFRKNIRLVGSFDYNVVIAGTKKMAYPYPKKLRLCLMKEFLDSLERKSK